MKALVAVGTPSNSPKPAKPELFNKAHSDTLKKIIRNPVTAPRKGALSLYGTEVLMIIINEIGALPTRNAKSVMFEHAYEISGENMRKTILIDTPTCWSCPVACKRKTKGKNYNYESEGPEYESSWALGANIGVGDIDAVGYMNYLANDYGLDTIELGNTLSVAAEASERGLIDEKIQWGDAKKFTELINLIVKREGIGEILAQGSYNAAKAFGDPYIAKAVKKLGIAAYDPRGIIGIELEYATSNMGGSHMRGYTPAIEVVGAPYKLDPLKYEGKAKFVKDLQDFTAVVDSLDTCQFAMFALDPHDFTLLLDVFTGWDMDTDQVLKAGERIWNLERYINQLYGFSKKDDTLPERFFKEPADAGPAKGRTVSKEQFEAMLTEYYKLRGWYYFRY